MMAKKQALGPSALTHLITTGELGGAEEPAALGAQSESMTAQQDMTQQSDVVTSYHTMTSQHDVTMPRFPLPEPRQEAERLVSTTIRLTPELRAWVDAFCTTRRTSMNKLVVRYLEELRKTYGS